jgi:RHS repeat-associated protein
MLSAALSLSAAPIVSGSGPRPQSAVIRSTSGPATLWASGQYQYDGVGNVTAMGVANVLPNSDGRVSTFMYDLASRLTNAAVGRAAGDRVETYSYDGFGNLTQRTLNTAPGAYNPAPDPVTNHMTETGTHYDEAGNMDNWATMASFTYDALNQMTSALPNQPGTYQSYFLYDVNDERVAVQSGSSIQWTVRDHDNRPVRQFQSGLLTDPGWSATGWSWVEDYVWNGSLLVGGNRPPVTGDQRHFHVDHLGSIRLATDATGGLVSAHDYAPFGEELTQAAASDEPIRFTAHERDGNFDYMHARYYDWRRGRFLSPDPRTEATKAVHQPQRWNLYEYVLDNPVGNTDPDGRETNPVTGHGGISDAELRTNAGNPNVGKFGHTRSGNNWNGGNHNGVDIAAPKGSPLRAPISGVVATVRHSARGGNVVFITARVAGHTVRIGMAHMSTIAVKDGQHVREGATMIGTSGDTGNAKGLPVAEQHVHLTVRVDGEVRNPQPHFHDNPPIPRNMQMPQ